jgi:hypothetical protein
MEPITAGLGVAAKVADEVTEVSGGLLTRLLGPLADQVGLELVEKHKQKNVQRVVELAAKKVRLADSASVPPRLAASVFDAAAFSDNEFVAEYLSGVLASARTPEGDDDRGVSWTALVSRLSSAQLAVHYAIYVAFRKLVVGREAVTINDWLKPIFMPYDELLAFVLGGREDGLLDALYGLNSEGLTERMAHGGADFLASAIQPHREFPSAGFYVTPTVRGISLFLEAHGYGGEWATAIGDVSKEFKVASEMTGLGTEAAAVWVDDLPT